MHQCHKHPSRGNCKGQTVISTSALHKYVTSIQYIFNLSLVKAQVRRDRENRVDTVVVTTSRERGYKNVPATKNEDAYGEINETHVRKITHDQVTPCAQTIQHGKAAKCSLVRAKG